jgi:hypothetical protein
MERIYKYITTYSEEDTLLRSHRLTDEDLEFILSVDSIEIYSNGKDYHWDRDKPGFDVTVYFMRTTPEKIERIKNLDHVLHHDANGISICEDISEEVLYDMYDCSEYGFAEDSIIIMFYLWRRSVLTPDDLLDKISKHGMESLTPLEKNFLDTGKLENPIVYKYDADQ